MALKTHPIGTEGVYEDNLPRVAGVEVEIRKAKRYESRMGSRGEGRTKEKENGATNPRVRELISPIQKYYAIQES